MEISTIFGVPAHPLFVHVPVLGIPLMVLALIAYVLLPAKRGMLFWPTTILVGAVTFATVLAAGSGEQLEAMMPPDDRASSLLQKHTELGDQTRTIVLIFAAFALGYLALDWWRRNRLTDISPETGRTTTVSEQPGRLNTILVVMGIAAIVTGSVATVWDIRTGHAGAKSSWGDIASNTGEE